MYMRREKEKKNLSKIQIPIVAAMSSVGVFHMMEMDGKPFLVCTLTPSSGDALAMDSGGDDLPLQPLFSCPRARDRYQSSRLMKDGDDDEDYDEESNNITRNMYDLVMADELVDKQLLPYNSSPYFPSTRSGGGSLLDCDNRYFCKLSVVPLNKKPDSKDFGCGLCRLSVSSTSYYACRECGDNFHKECVESPLEIKHPSHPFHSLQLCTPILCQTKIEDCTSCGTRLIGMTYNCTICELRMHPFCAMRPVPFVVDHPKSHPHPLTFFPTQASLVCHFCALIKKLDPTYICIQCGFAIHKDCMSYPQVIRISRHHHRVSFAPTLPSRKLSCGVCHQEVDNHYGSYSCNKCAYFVHSKCALNRKVWDGKDLDGVPEENDKIDDGEPFKRIAYGIIHHPFHSHHLRLEIFKDYDENKYCRGCAFPIYGGHFYSCMECDFILHDGCANAPRMKRHPAHPVPLTLKVATMAYDSEQGRIQCKRCQRDVSGFYYDGVSVRLDLQCASIIEPFGYLGHKHPLFLPWDQHKGTRCQICKEECEDSKLICMECDYTICFRCVTLPYKVRYKHDSHFLTLCDEKESNDQPDWCEICEGKIAEGTKICEGRIEEEIRIWNRRTQRRERRFYKCNSCCTSLHVECLLGLDIYMKSGQVIKDCIPFFSGFEMTSSSFHMNMDVQIRVNSSLSRPICDRCKRRCPFPIYFIAHYRRFCSWYCTKNAKY